MSDSTKLAAAAVGGGLAALLLVKLGKPYFCPGCPGFSGRKTTSYPVAARGGGLKEFSVVYTDRAVNLMSSPFQETMRKLNKTFKEVYNCEKVAIIPGSGSYGMEAVARSFGRDRKVMVLRNGFFSYRWSDIFATIGIGAEETILMARPVKGEESSATPAFEPAPIDEVVATIKSQKPKTVFAPHVETSAGIILPDDYVRKVGAAAHEVGAVFVLDCIASGTIWVDMKDLNVDVVISAPQKGWSGPACAGYVFLSKFAADKLKEEGAAGPGQGYATNLARWLDVMDAYEGGAFKYFTTLPTDALMIAADAAEETVKYGLAKSKKDLQELGIRVRGELKSRGLKSVAARGFEAPGVVVVYTAADNAVASFKKEGMQIAGGVPLMVNEPTPFTTFRLGLFGLDKIADVGRTVKELANTMDRAATELKASK